jgi:hypothetical protein
LNHNLRYIISHKRSKIKRRAYLIIILISLVPLAIGITLVCKAYEMGSLAWIVTGWILIGLTVLLLFWSIYKLRVENTYEEIVTGLSVKENFKRSREVLLRTFGEVKLFGSADDGVISCSARSGRGSIKLITLISLDKKILLNCRDKKALFSISGRIKILKRIRKGISA